MTLLMTIRNWRHQLAAQPAKTRNCGNCRHFRNEPAYLEASFPGFQTMSSGYSAVRREDGICAVHDRYLDADSHCGHYLPR